MMCWITATKYGAAIFLKNKNMGKKRRQKSSIECRGPRCTKPGINISMSGKTDAKNSKGRLTLTPSFLDVNFPVKYPKAKCPTAYMNCSLKHLGAKLFSLSNIKNPISKFVVCLNVPNSSNQNTVELSLVIPSFLPLPRRVTKTFQIPRRV